MQGMAGYELRSREERYHRRSVEVEIITTLEDALKRIEQLEQENAGLREELGYSKNGTPALSKFPQSK